MEAELSPGGHGIHWPLIDEDLSVSGLLRDIHRSTQLLTTLSSHAEGNLSAATAGLSL
jgi:hypothetical protein